MNVRNEISDLYKEKKVMLGSTKERLWAKGDPSKWKLDRGKMDVSYQQISDNKELALKYMLPVVRNFKIVPSNFLGN